MDNWGADISTNELIGNSDQKWKVLVNTIEKDLQALKNNTDDMKQKFNRIRSNQDFNEGFQSWLHKNTNLCNEITRNLNELSK